MPILQIRQMERDYKSAAKQRRTDGERRKAHCLKYAAARRVKRARPTVTARLPPGFEGGLTPRESDQTLFNFQS